MRLSAKHSVFTMIFVGLANGCAMASATNTYIAQSSAGTADGSNCANARAYTFFNAAGNWGSGSGQIGPGTIVHLCGTISTELEVQASGISGGVIEVLWESGAKVSLGVGSAISLNGYSNLLFDGGSPCGPGTVCSTRDSGTGIIENTANGSSLANKTVGLGAFDGTSGGNLEFRNLIIRNFYQHTSLGDSTDSADTNTYAFVCNPCAGTISMHDSTFHDMGTVLKIESPSNATVNFYRNYVYNDNWAIEDSGDGARTVSIHDNHFGSTTNWDTTSDSFHHNVLHLYMNTASDSIRTEFYNNLSDGDWGTCCTTATFIYQEFAIPNNFYVFNNVEIQYPGNLQPAWIFSGTPILFVNNTHIGVATTSSNVEATLIGGKVTIENNATEGYGQFIQVYGPGLSVTAIDYNVYGAIGISGNPPWQYGTTGANDFSSWKSACSCDSHGANPARLGVNASGVPQAGSALIGAGVNLTSLGIAPLNFDTSAGGTRTPVARPATGAWDVGAYQHSAATGPNPPSNLTAIVH